MRVRHGTRVRVAVSTAARGVAGPGKGSAEKGEPGGARRGGLGCGALACAPWRPEGEVPAQALLPAPPLGRFALPWLAPALPAGLRNALSRPRALAVSATHQLQHQQQRRRHRPPSAAAAATTTFSSAVLFCPRLLSIIRL